MKILIVSDLYKPSINGVVASIMNLRSGMESLGHEVRILTMSHTTKSYMEDGVYYIGSMNAERIYPNTRLSIKNIRKEKKDILEWGPDIIHTQNEFCTFYIAKKIAKNTNIPVIDTYHTVYGDYTHYFFKSKRLGLTAVVICTKLLGRNVNCIVAPTNKIYNILNRYGVACPVHTIPSGISLEKFYRKASEDKMLEIRRNLNIPDNHMILLSVSRLGKEKNLDQLIRCMEQVKGQDVTLVIVGDGPEKKRLEKFTEKIGVYNQVKFTGMVSPKIVPVYYQMADLFVSASTSESQGLTYIESLASGTPILCKVDDCLIGVLDEGVNGYLFNNEEEFNKKLDIFIKSDRKAELSQNAKVSVKKFSKESFVKSLENLYEMYIRKAESPEIREPRIMRIIRKFSRRRRYT